MQLAAMVNDRAEFREAFRNTQEAYEKVYARNPLPGEDRMARMDRAKGAAISSFASRHPMTAIFRSKPDEMMTRKILRQIENNYSEQGAQDVRDAIRLHERYMAMLSDMRPSSGGGVKMPALPLMPKLPNAQIAIGF
jgi:hypothetical protein